MQLSDWLWRMLTIYTFIEWNLSKIYILRYVWTTTCQIGSNSRRIETHLLLALSFERPVSLLPWGTAEVRADVLNWCCHYISSFPPYCCHQEKTSLWCPWSTPALTQPPVFSDCMTVKVFLSMQIQRHVFKVIKFKMWVINQHQRTSV